MRGNREQGVGNSVQKLKKLAALGAMAVTLVLAGCRQDMQDQPKFFPQRGTDFYADGRSVRPQVENTVARGQLRENAYFYTGLVNGKEGEGMPFPATLEVLERGQERYNVYCTPCHSRVGNGVGLLETAPLGHFFHVISNGYGAMPDYAAQLVPADRWAIVAYIKALQLSQKATQADVPAGVRVEPLSSIAEREGLPASFADEWTLPPTAVTGTPDNGLYVLPVPGAAPSANGEGSTSRSNANPAAGTPAGPKAPQQSGVPKQ